ncbi:unnamed protein product [Dovyalis caffra]|uniref:Uncharacterized protein n=1 Tax=Dovyalis caffra TaxID=77055 RepID=A0AAV1SWM3_9ROSI|nr:unnamed protein product [Dovyalis caffra]
MAEVGPVTTRANQAINSYKHKEESNMISHHLINLHFNHNIKNHSHTVDINASWSSTLDKRIMSLHVFEKKKENQMKNTEAKEPIGSTVREIRRLVQNNITRNICMAS